MQAVARDKASGTSDSVGHATTIQELAEKSGGQA
jgi:hypothetical protein